MVPTSINAPELSSKLTTATPQGQWPGFPVFRSQQVAICPMTSHQDYLSITSFSLKPSHLGCRLTVLLQPLQMSTLTVHIVGHIANAQQFLTYRGPHSMSLPLRSPPGSPRQKLLFSPAPSSFHPWVPMVLLTTWGPPQVGTAGFQPCPHPTLSSCLRASIMSSSYHPAKSLTLNKCSLAKWLIKVDRRQRIPYVKGAGRKILDS